MWSIGDDAGLMHWPRVPAALLVGAAGVIGNHANSSWVCWANRSPGTCTVWTAPYTRFPEPGRMHLNARFTSHSDSRCPAHLLAHTQWWTHAGSYLGIRLVTEEGDALSVEAGQ